jgi:hypothetical protein
MLYIDPAIRSFGGFLAAFGPRRHKHLTLDRLDNSNLNYGPGLCAWRDKTEQARNRRSTQFVKHPRSGKMISLADLADELRKPASRLRRQLRDGWSVEEMIAGRRERPHETWRTNGADTWPWPIEPYKKQIWEREYRRCRVLYETGFEYRLEFAVRWLKNASLETSEWVLQTWARYDRELPPAFQTMPADIRHDFETRCANLNLIGVRLSEARVALEALYEMYPPPPRERKAKPRYGTSDHQSDHDSREQL